LAATLSELVRQGILRAKVAERPDLQRRLEQTRLRLVQPTARVMVVGEFKQGKSQLVNALVNAPICPVDDDVMTAVPTVVSHGDTTAAWVTVAKVDTGELGSAPTELERRSVTVEELARHVTLRETEGREQVISAEVELPRKILAGGLTLIDTPGIGGLNSTAALATLTGLPSADAMLFVTDASQELTEPELQFLGHALSMTENVACILSKIDLYANWRTIAEGIQRRLDELRPGIPLFAVSSELRIEAVRSNDLELNAESGFPALVAFLRTEVVQNITVLQNQSVTHDILSVADHLELSLQSELSALTDPEGTPGVLANLERAKEENDELRRRSARWQITLGDGMSDLTSDMDYDLRDRMRSIQREADAAIEKGDPALVWDEMIDWLEQRVASAIADTFVWNEQRSRWLSEQVASHFSDVEVRLPDIRVDSTEDVLDPVEIVPPLDPGQLGFMQKVLIGMRGSYGGVLMIGLMTGIAGLSLINPISLAAGILIGRRAFSDDKEARITRRQMEGKALIRRQIEDVVFHVGKQLKDRMRFVQRAVRDHFTEIADEHHRSLADSLAAAQKAARLFSQEREQRIIQIRIELKKVQALREQTPEIAAESRAARPVRAIR